MIHSTSEFEAVIGDVVRTLGKVIYARGSDTKLEGARRGLEAIVQCLERKRRPEPKEIEGLREAATAIRAEGLHMPGLDDHTYDLEDFLEFNPTAGLPPPPPEDEE